MRTVSLPTPDALELVGELPGVRFVVWDGTGDPPDGARADRVLRRALRRATAAGRRVRGDAGRAGRPARVRGRRALAAGDPGRRAAVQRTGRARRVDRRTRSRRDARRTARAAPVPGRAGRAPLGARRHPRPGRTPGARPRRGRHRPADRHRVRGVRRRGHARGAHARATASAPWTTCPRCCPSRTSWWSRSRTRRPRTGWSTRSSWPPCPTARCSSTSRAAASSTPTALLAELNAGRLHAFLDVTDPEPLPADHPLWDAPNLLLTPHVGGGTRGWPRRAYRLVREQLERWLAGQELAEPGDRGLLAPTRSGRRRLSHRVGQLG